MRELGVKNNFLGLEKKDSSFRNAGIVLLPINYNAGNSAGSNSRAFTQIFKSSRSLERYDEEMSQEITNENCICTLEPMKFQNKSYQSISSNISKLIKSLAGKDKFVLSICSDHAATYGLIKGYNEKFENLSILHLDSKANLKEASEARSHHDSVMKKVSEFNSRIMQIGIRSQSKEENEYRKQNQIRQMLASEIKMGMYGKSWEEIANRNFTDHVYVTLDLSVFDPSIFSAVEQPEPGGLLWHEVLYLLRIVAKDHHIVGADISGPAIQKFDHASSYFIAKLIFKILNYIFYRR